MITNEYLYESYLLTCMWRLLKMSRMSDTSCRVVLILQKTVITYAVPVVRESPSFFCLLLYSRFGIKVIFREVSVSIHHHRTVLHVRRRLTTLQNPDYHLMVSRIAVPKFLFKVYMSWQRYSFNMWTVLSSTSFDWVISIRFLQKKLEAMCSLTLSWYDTTLL